jgi:hypothetical protein
MSSEKQDRNPTVNAPSNGAAKPGQVTKWSKHVHPDGWIYWYKCELEGDIETAEIRGALEGCIGQLRFGSSGELLPGGVAVKTPCPVTGFGGLRVLMYIDHNRRYASRQRTQVISKTQDYDECACQHIRIGIIMH